MPEAARLLRPGGRLVFLGNHTLLQLCAPDELAPAGDRLLRLVAPGMVTVALLFTVPVIMPPGANAKSAVVVDPVGGDAAGFPNDPDYGLQWNFNSPFGIDAPGAWSAGSSGTTCRRDRLQL